MDHPSQWFGHEVLETQIGVSYCVTEKPFVTALLLPSNLRVLARKMIDDCKPQYSVSVRLGTFQ